MSLIAKWKQRNGPKEKLLSQQEKKPQKEAEIEEIIKNVEAAQEKIKEAASAFKEASTNASKSFYEDLGVRGKVQRFFGFDPSEVETKKYALVQNNGIHFTIDPNGTYKIMDVTSPGFNISHFLENPEQAKELIDKMVSYTKILDLTGSP